MVSQKCYDAIIEMCERHRSKRIERERMEAEAAQRELMKDGET